MRWHKHCKTSRCALGRKQSYRNANFLAWRQTIASECALAARCDKQHQSSALQSRSQRRKDHSPLASLIFQKQSGYGGRKRLEFKLKGRFRWSCWVILTVRISISALPSSQHVDTGATHVALARFVRNLFVLSPSTGVSWSGWGAEYWTRRLREAAVSTRISGKGFLRRNSLEFEFGRFNSAPVLGLWTLDLLPCDCRCEISASTAFHSLALISFFTLSWIWLPTCSGSILSALVSAGGWLKSRGLLNYPAQTLQKYTCE